MNIDSRATSSAASLRDLLLQKYVSSSAGPHRPLTETELNGFLVAYRYYLRSWVPTPAEGGWLDLGCGQGALMRLALAYGLPRGTGGRSQRRDAGRCPGRRFDGREG